MNGVNVEPSYFRFNRSYPYRWPKGVRVSLEPVIRPGDTTEYDLLLYRSPDILCGFKISLPNFDRPTEDGLFEFWTEHWEGDERHRQYPWIHWAFQDVEWKGTQWGWCPVDHSKQKEMMEQSGGFTLRHLSGFMYVDRIPRLRVRV